MKHVQCAGGIVIWNDQVLIIHQNKNSWSLPKGHVEVGEPIEQAARREIQEESGITDLHLVRKLGIIQRYKIGINGQDDHSELKDIHVFLYLTAHGAVASSEPHSMPVWMPAQQIGHYLTHPKDAAFFIENQPNIAQYLCESISIISTTFPSRSLAEDMSRRLINSRMAACVQQWGPVDSTFEWQGQIQTQSEWRLDVKTTTAQAVTVVEMIRRYHPYDVPEILTTPVSGSLPAYRHWVSETVQANQSAALFTDLTEQSMV